MKYLKAFGFGVAYAVLMCVLPLIIYVSTDSGSSSGLLIFYLVTVFITLGFVVYTVVSREEPPKKNKELIEKLDNIEIQNAAIAFSLSEVKRAVKKNDLE